jgi:N-dimethylarginine dimethylaminohydrolase
MAVTGFSRLRYVTISYGVSSMVAPLHHLLMQRPTPAYGRAFDDPACGYLQPVDLDVAIKEHELLCELLTSLGVTVHQLNADSPHPDQIYTYDPALVTATGAVLLRSGKPGRRGEERFLADWFTGNGIPVTGRIEEPGTVDGGDVLWLRPGLVAIGRSLRTNQAGIDQLIPLLDQEAHVFDVPYGAGPAACLHLMSTLSMITADIALVDHPRLPAGLHALLVDLGIDIVETPPTEVDTLGTNVLAVRPGVAVAVAGNPQTMRLLEERGVEVHTFVGDEIAINGTGGPTCLTRPVLRA